MTRFAILRSAALAALLVLVSACNSAPKRDAAYAPMLPAARPAPPQAVSGAIYQSGYDVALFEDVRARRIGDLLTIRLIEATNAQKSASTKTGKTSSATIENPTILGTTPQFGLPGVLPLASTSNNTLETTVSSANDFEGSGDSSQSNKLSGDLTVTVADVLPNGNLIVRGEKRLNLNEGNEYVKLSGIVRPIDIRADNSVLSTKVADATIIYAGDGAPADASKLGWISRFFVSALFPF
ncbi:MAG: flagellar basal body L-ring protein FlgH [Gammaproteobacteria bacterium]|nr:flagellar basal body L-ring protein FlgH [Gammaproteobacteria bacterium]